jgi:hypothetical protein
MRDAPELEFGGPDVDGDAPEPEFGGPDVDGDAPELEFCGPDVDGDAYCEISYAIDRVVFAIGVYGGSVLGLSKPDS